MQSAKTLMMTSNSKITKVVLIKSLYNNFLIFSASIFAGKAMVPTPARETLEVLSLLRKMEGQ